MRRAWCNGRLLVLAWLAVLVARATPVQFDIPPQPAHTALLAFSKQSRLDVLFPLEELKRKNSPGVVGAYEPEVALAKILAGTGYAAQQGAKGKFVIAPVVAQAGGIRGRLVTPDSRPAGGVTVAVARKLIEQGKIDRDGSTVLCITGNGLKTQEALIDHLARPIVIKPTIEAFDALVEAHGAHAHADAVVGAGA